MVSRRRLISCEAGVAAFIFHFSFCFLVDVFFVYAIFAGLFPGVLFTKRRRGRIPVAFTAFITLVPSKI